MNRPLALLLSAAAAVALVAGCASRTEVAGSPTASQAEDADIDVVSPSPVIEEPEPDPLDLDDFIATLKVTDKQCFGTAGCNVTVEPRLEYVHALETLENRTYSVTLSISGDESGPVITTIDGTGGSYNVMPIVLSTTRSGVKPKAKITDVQEY